MTCLHVCLSNLPGQLVRWQKAFPYGRIISSVDDLAPFAGNKLLLWLHADPLDPATLQNTIRTLRQYTPEARIVALTGMPDPARTAHLLKMGIRGCCHVLAAPELFKRVAKVTSNGGYWLGEELLTHLIQALPQTVEQAPDKDNPDPLNVLTQREQAVAHLVAQGASNREISETLGISEKTVKAHLSSIFQKLDIRDRLQLALLVRTRRQ